MSDLTPKQALFIQEYLVDLNATQAAIRAGYSPDTAYQTGYENLRKPNIAEAIAAAQAELSERTKVTQEYVIGTLKEVVERCMQREPVMVRRGKEMVQLVDEDDRNVWRFDAKGANGALTLLGKYLGLYTERVQHTGDGGPVQVVVTHNVVDPSAG